MKQEAPIARVLAEIRRRDEVARVDLADALDLSPATVTSATATLLESGLIVESQSTAGAGRGRPRVQLALNADACLVAGAKLNAGSVTVALLNFCGEVLADSTASFTGDTIGPEAMTSALMGALDEVLGQLGITAEHLMAFGMGIPGFVETESGLCHWSPILTGAPVDVRALLSAHLPCPVFVDNDANLVTLAELWFGLGKTETNFLVATVEHGVGLGIVINGALYRGGRGLGAEFGHTKVQIDGALCRCGQRGCLEAYVADFALAREASAALSDEGAATADALVRLAEEARLGRPIPASIYQRAGRMLGLGLANLANIFDPDLIVMAGERMATHDLMAAEVEATLSANRIVADRAPTPVRIHRWGDSLWARGAGALALDGVSVDLISDTKLAKSA
ncbi:MAG: ROK family transcriptional regulator [Pseudomonadota bacterium]